MRPKISIFLIVGLMVSICSLATLAQVKKQKAQFYFIEEVSVKLSMVEKYETHTKEALDLWTRYGSPFPFYAFVTDDFHYYFVWPIENYASLDSLFRAIGEWVGKMGDENWQALVKSGEGTYEYMKWSMVRHRPDLSYSLEKPRLKPEEENFVIWYYFYIIPGKEQELEEVWNKFLPLFKRKNITEEYSTFVGDMGTEMPVYIIGYRGKSASDFWLHHEKVRELLAPENILLLQKTFALTRRLEYRSGWFRPDLSYIPKEK